MKRPFLPLLSAVAALAFVVPGCGGTGSAGGCSASVTTVGSDSSNTVTAGGLAVFHGTNISPNDTYTLDFVNKTTQATTHVSTQVVSESGGGNVLVANLPGDLSAGQYTVNVKSSGCSDGNVGTFNTVTVQ
jgi:hypothetical protein